MSGNIRMYMKPKVCFYGKDREIITRRDMIKKRTFELRRKLNLKNNY